MSTTIRSMSMPRDCEHCVLCDYEQANCLVANDRNTLPHISNERPDWCPLTEVPTLHGRLIDADALLSSLAYNLGIRSLEYLTSQERAIVSWIDAAPTVIPAEEGET